MSQTEHQLSLSRFYAGWDVYQQHLVAAIAPLSSEQLVPRLVVPHANGRGQRRSYFSRIMGSRNL